MSLLTKMKSEVIPSLKKELSQKNNLALPRIREVKVQVGIGSLLQTTKDFTDVTLNMAKITGQKPIIIKAKQAVSNFKLRKGMPVAILSTLRGARALDFIDRLVNIALPRVRDFRGISLRSFDGHGNLSIGLREALVFPEINPDDVINVHGLQVTIVTTAQTDEEGFALLKAMGFPFKKEETPNP